MHAAANRAVLYEVAFEYILKTWGSVHCRATLEAAAGSQAIQGSAAEGAIQLVVADLRKLFEAAKIGVNLAQEREDEEAKRELAEAEEKRQAAFARLEAALAGRTPAVRERVMAYARQWDAPWRWEGDKLGAFIEDTIIKSRASRAGNVGGQ